MNLTSDPIRGFLEETCRLGRQLDPQAIARARDLLMALLKSALGGSLYER